jgi:hypothetical protein
MIIARILRSKRAWLAAGLLGLLPLSSGCGDEKATNAPQGAPQPAAEQDAMRKAREAQYGSSANPSTKPGGPAPAAKSAEAPKADTPKPDEKSAAPK